MQTDTRHSVAATETPTDVQCRARTVGRSYISLLVRLFVFPGLESRLIFLFALFPMYESLILTPSRGTVTSSPCANRAPTVLIHQLLSCLALQGAVASLLAAKSADWCRAQAVKGMPVMVQRGPGTAARSEQGRRGPGRSSSKKKGASWWLI